MTSIGQCMLFEDNTEFNNQSAMLKILTGDEVVLAPYSPTDARLRGTISLRNELKDHYIVYKLKSTNNALFEAEPSRGILRPLQNQAISIMTLLPVNAELARDISQKNKFMVEYIAQEHCPISIDEAVMRLKGPAVQHTKIFINTNSVRGALQGKSIQDPSMVNSNRFSFHSMAGAQPTPLQTYQTREQPASDIMDKLKIETDNLEKVRSNLIKELSKKETKKGGYLKHIVVFIVGLIGGNLANKHLQVTQKVQEKVSEIWTGEQPVKEEEEGGILSILNIGGDDEQVVVVEENDSENEKKPWWHIL